MNLSLWNIAGSLSRETVKLGTLSNGEEVGFLTKGYSPRLVVGLKQINFTSTGSCVTNDHKFLWRNFLTNATEEDKDLLYSSRDAFLQWREGDNA